MGDDVKRVEIPLILYGKPADEIENFDGMELDKSFSEKLKQIGDELQKRLHEVAKIHKLLVKNGWEAVGGVNTIVYSKELSIEEAEDELESLGLTELAGYLREVE